MEELKALGHRLHTADALIFTFGGQQVDELQAMAQDSAEIIPRIHLTLEGESASI